MTCVAFNEDSTLVAAGFQGSYVRIWSLDGKPLESAVKRPQESSVPRKLEEINWT